MKVPRRLETIASFGLEGSERDRLKLGGNIWSLRSERWTLCAPDLFEKPQIVVIIIAELTGKHLIKADPCAENIAPLIKRVSPCLLWRHVVKFAFKNTMLGLLPMARFCDPEIDEFDLSFRRNQDVLWANIAVNNLKWPAILVAPLMRVIKPRAGFNGDKSCELYREEK